MNNRTCDYNKNYKSSRSPHPKSVTAVHNINGLTPTTTPRVSRCFRPNDARRWCEQWQKKNCWISSPVGILIRFDRRAAGIIRTIFRFYIIIVVSSVNLLRVITHTHTNTHTLVVIWRWYTCTQYPIWSILHSVRRRVRVFYSTGRL